MFFLNTVVACSTYQVNELLLPYEVNIALEASQYQALYSHKSKDTRVFLFSSCTILFWNQCHSYHS